MTRLLVGCSHTGSVLEGNVRRSILAREVGSLVLLDEPIASSKRRYLALR